MAESLPDELYLLIFRYLHKFDRIHAFANLNHRFQRLIEPYLYDIEFASRNGDTVPYKAFHVFYQDILPWGAEHIRSLTLSHYQQYRLLASHLSRLVHLESLVLGSNIQLNVNDLQEVLRSLPSLSSLSIHHADQALLAVIAAHQPTQLHTLFLSHYDGLELRNANMEPIPSIRRFSGTLISIETLANVFEMMPNLEELSVSWTQFSSLEKMPSELRIPPKLTRLHIEIGSYRSYIWQKSYNPRLAQLKQFLHPFANQLRSLTLIALNVDSEDFSHYDTLQSLVQGDNHCIHLESFQYHILTNHQPEQYRFPHVEQLPDQTYSISTLPKPIQFDRVSIRAVLNCHVHQATTLAKLFNAQALTLDSCGGCPSLSWELQPDLQFLRLQQIVCDDPINDFSSDLRKLLSTVIERSPNLSRFVLRIQWGQTKDAIERVREAFGKENGKCIKYFEMPICMVNDESSYSYPVLFSHISRIFPNVQRLEFYVEQNALNNCYQSILVLIDEMREKFPKLVHFRLRMYLRDEIDEQGMERYKKDLDQRSDSLYYSVTPVQGTYHHLDLWL